jgi:hypothetical protein
MLGSPNLVCKKSIYQSCKEKFKLKFIKRKSKSK